MIKVSGTDQARANALNETGFRTLLRGRLAARYLYRGHFLQGDDDAPWAMHLRERLRMNVVARLNQSAQGALAQGQIESAERLYELGLRVGDLVT